MLPWTLNPTDMLDDAIMREGSGTTSAKSRSGGTS